LKRPFDDLEEWIKPGGGRSKKTPPHPLKRCIEMNQSTPSLYTNDLSQDLRTRDGRVRKRQMVSMGYKQVGSINELLFDEAMDKRSPFSLVEQNFSDR
jgi:hypothetical protein